MLAELASLLLLCSCAAGPPVTIWDVLWRTGPSQSNGRGVNAAGGADAGAPPIAAVPYWDSYILTSESDPDAALKANALTPLNSVHGSDYTIGRSLYEAGLNPIVVNASRGSTFSAQWIPRVPPEVVYTAMVTEITQAWGFIQATYPSDSFRHWHVTDQGESEARYGTPGSETPAEIAIVSAWADNAQASHDTLEAIIGAPMDRIVLRTNSNISGKTLPGLLESLQLEFAGDEVRCVIQDQFQWEGDGVHKTSLGYYQAGLAVAGRILQILATAELRQFSTAHLQLRLSNPLAQAQHWAAPAMARLFETASLGLGLSVVEAASSNTIGAATSPDLIYGIFSATDMTPYGVFAR